MFCDQRVPKQIPRRRPIIELARELNGAFPLLGLGVATADLHQRNEFGLLPFAQPLQPFSDFLSREILGIILESVPHLVVHGIGTRVGIDFSLFGLHSAGGDDEFGQVVRGEREGGRCVFHSLQTRSRRPLFRPRSGAEGGGAGPSTAA